MRNLFFFMSVDAITPNYSSISIFVGFYNFCRKQHPAGVDWAVGENRFDHLQFIFQFFEINNDLPANRKETLPPIWLLLVIRFEAFEDGAYRALNDIKSKLLTRLHTHFWCRLTFTLSLEMKMLHFFAAHLLIRTFHRRCIICIFYMVYLYYVQWRQIRPTNQKQTLWNNFPSVVNVLVFHSIKVNNCNQIERAFSSFIVYISVCCFRFCLFFQSVWSSFVYSPFCFVLCSSLLLLSFLYNSMLSCSFSISLSLSFFLSSDLPLCSIHSLTL